MKATILLRMPVNMREENPQLAALRILSDIIEYGISALRQQYHPLHRWTVKVDEDSGIIEISDR